MKTSFNAIYIIILLYMINRFVVMGKSQTKSQCQFTNLWQNRFKSVTVTVAVTSAFRLRLLLKDRRRITEASLRSLVFVLFVSNLKSNLKTQL